jgi:hypothetical protein
MLSRFLNQRELPLPLEYIILTLIAADDSCPLIVIASAAKPARFDTVFQHPKLNQANLHHS